MSDLRIIPDEPWSEARETYRRFATEDRPGDPWSVPFEPRRRTPSLYGCALKGRFWLGVFLMVLWFVGLSVG